MNELMELKAKIKSFTEQLITLLKDLKFQQIYTSKSNLVEGSTVGQHIRHIFDHFNILISCLELNKELVDYDSRERNVKIETECYEALIHFEHLLVRIISIDNPLDQTLKVKFIIDSNPVTKLISNSTVSRELWFCTHHAVHHLALIKVIGKEFGYETNSSLGIAPATANYKSRLEKAA